MQSAFSMSTEDAQNGVQSREELSLFVVSLSMLTWQPCVYSTHVCLQVRHKMLVLLLYQQRTCEQLDKQIDKIVKGEHSVADGQK